MSYGQVLYQAPDYPLFGRWHIDRANSFWAGHCALDGLLEVARLSRDPGAARGAALDRDGDQLDPARLGMARRLPDPVEEEPAGGVEVGWQFIHADRGGLVFQPLTGLHEDVWELDFVSMYPSIMVRENVSPETIGCSCCEPRADVPEVGYDDLPAARGDDGADAGADHRQARAL